ncbi:RNA polymerase sigma-70 factor [Longitalea luteola]|uniref:RNA polymerase sigma-70 factor n=1 Tax=Longitalea luteola TaxID=2812563 RepID=UPI001A97B86A|nr:RNA polymerase sigma-70 factor [Longitalea luteola]
MNFKSPENKPEGASAGHVRFDDASFEEFFKKHFLPLCAFCQFRYGLDLDMAKEMVHSGFIKLWDARDNLAPGVSPRNYLYKIISNNILDNLKHRKIRQQYVQFMLQSVAEDDPANGFNNVDVKQLQAAIDTAIGELPEQMRRIFEMSRFEGLKYSEIADRMNISVKTVETQISRALAKLREKLASWLSFGIILLAFILLLNK